MPVQTGAAARPKLYILKKKTPRRPARWGGRPCAANLEEQPPRGSRPGSCFRKQLPGRGPRGDLQSGGGELVVYIEMDAFLLFGNLEPQEIYMGTRGHRVKAEWIGDDISQGAGGHVLPI